MITSEKLIELLMSSGADISEETIKSDVLFSDIGLDSLDLYNFFSEIDSELGIEVPDEDFVELQNIEQVVIYLNQNR
jgi:acyl carrier protein